MPNQNNTPISPTLFSLKESWKNAKNFSLSRVGSFFTSKRRSTQNLTIDRIKTWLNNPQKYQTEIIDLSDSLYAPEGLYKTLVNLTTNMATLDNYLQPTNSTMRKLNLEIKAKTKLDELGNPIDKEAFDKILLNFENEFDSVRNYIENIDIKKTGRRIIESLVRYGAYCGFEKNDGNFPYLWDLPIKYVRLYSIKSGQYKVEFNFRYFDDLSRDNELNEFVWELYPIEFQNLYNKYKTNPDRMRYPEWQPLPSEKVCCIKLGGDNESFFLPLYSQLFTELFLLNDLIDEEIEDSRDQKIKMLAIEFPHDPESGIPLIEPERVHEWVDVVASGCSDNVCVIGAPYKINEIPFKSIQNEKTNLAEFAKTMAYMQAGANPLLLGGSSTNSSVGITQNLVYIQSLVFSMLDKIQSWFNYRISNVNLRKKYTFKLNIWKITYFNQQEEFDKEYKLTTIGGSLNIISSMAGHNADDYNSTLLYENLIKSKSNWRTPVNMNQNSGNQDDKGGRPSVADGDLSDAGTVSRDKENNNR
ncbi:MAG: hypothetical protein PHY08_08490 [Candidatus Cloacimonetes bacterium]|nr:hypothetical protein [Candidatus Cloacimonadota bacterium]